MVLRDILLLSNKKQMKKEKKVFICTSALNQILIWFSLSLSPRVGLVAMNSRAHLEGGSAAAQGEAEGGARDDRAWQSRDGVANHPVCLRLRGFLRLKTFNAETREVLGKLECLVTIAGWRDRQEWIWGELSRPRVYYPKVSEEPGLWCLARSPRHL